MIDQQDQDRIIIIGAGLSGLALGQGLKKAKIPFIIFDNDEKDSKKIIDNPFGWKFLLLVDGLIALRQLIPLNLYSFLRKINQFKNQGYTSCIFDKDSFKLLLKLDVESQSTNQDDPLYKDLMVERTLLREVLMEGIKENICFNKTFSHYEEDSNGVTVHFKQQEESYKGLLLVAADGINSTIRKQKLPNFPPLKSSEIRLIMVKIRLDSQSKKDLLPKDLGKTSLNLVLGKKPIFSSIVPSKYSKDPFENLTEIERKEFKTLSERIRPILYDSCILSIWSAEKNMPKEIQQGKIAKKGKELLDFIIQKCENEYKYNSNFISLLRQSDPSTCWTTNFCSSVDPGSWNPSRVTFIGDSIHPMLPFLSRGANTAFEDALSLSNQLRSIWNSENRSSLMIKAVSKYESEMHPRAFKHVQDSFNAINGYQIIHNSYFGPIVIRMVRLGLHFIRRVPPLQRLLVRILRQEHGYGRARMFNQEQQQKQL